MNQSDGRKNLTLVINLFKVSLRDRYLGSGLGPLWAVINPLILLSIYTLLFSFVFQARMPGMSGGDSYINWFICGFVPMLFISDSFNIAATSIIKNASLVKNIVFKVEYLPIADTIVAMVPFGIGLTFLLFLIIFNHSYLSWHSVLILPMIIAQCIFLCGIAYYISATGVFVRDIAQLLPPFVMLITFGTPIFYPIEAMPDSIQRITFFNPFYQFIQAYRDILIFHRNPDLLGCLYVTVLAVAIFASGNFYFNKLKSYFHIAL